METEAIKKLHHIALKSSERLNSQSSTFKHNHTKATTLIGAIAIFIPLYFNIIKDVNTTFQYLSIIPILLICFSLFIAFKVLLPKKMAYGFKTEKYNDLIKKSFKDNLLFEIGINNKAFDKNFDVIEKQSSNLKNGIILLGISIFLTLVILSLGIYLK